MGKHVTFTSVTFRRSKFSAVTFAGFQRSFDAQQLSSTRSIGADRVVYLSGSGIFTCQQQHGLQILLRQLFLGLPDSQILCLRTRLSDRALFWEAQLLSCLVTTSQKMVELFCGRNRAAAATSEKASSQIFVTTSAKLRLLQPCVLHCVSRMLRSRPSSSKAANSAEKAGQVAGNS